MTSNYEKPELIELGVLSMDTLSSSSAPTRGRALKHGDENEEMEYEEYLEWEADQER